MSEWRSKLIGTKVSEFSINDAHLLSDSLTAARDIVIPDKDGTIAFLDDIVLSSRSIIVTSGNLTIGATDNTDYIVLVSGNHIITMPTAISNSNRYTIKNNHSSVITINTTSSETIDSSTSIEISPEDSVDLISDNENWYVI